MLSFRKVVDFMLLNISEAAKLVGVCENTLRVWDESGKFRAVRTEGGHRRYSLDQVREYIDEHQEIEERCEQLTELTENEKMIEKWQDELDGVSDFNDKKIISVLLENADSYYTTDSFLSKEQILWLTKESWIRTKLRKLVTVQTLSHPCDLVVYLENNQILNEALAAKTISYNFKIFNTKLFDNVKDLYADVIAAELDTIILDLLPKINVEVLTDSYITKSIGKLGDFYDYLVAPESMVEGITKSSRWTLDNIKLYSSPTILDPNSYLPIVAAGKFPGKLSKPIFAPYQTVVVAPQTVTGVRSCMLRYAVYPKK
jgi:excisionase family DNA binding protein